ncbi:hypothetical protein VB712_17840 [Spirulina sp. CCNP1310]|uniref:hypothetical protein n=1 Tax=Spirulina sp. CCNP1310 TaxID=3110249 RepID=UPI002B203001|nr:hypothetical protein [Spirulina sp. CCNP1310]MEA5421091.1 hypothetical protein [Spirulina sp. CCNP1310]
MKNSQINYKKIVEFLMGKTRGFPNWLIVILTFLFFVGWVSSPSSQPSPPRTSVKPIQTPSTAIPSPSPSPIEPKITPKMYDSNVRAICKTLAELELVSPRTAKHQLVLPTFDPETQVWTMRAWVDSQNQLGAMVRNQYICTVVDSSQQGILEWVGR